jgi:hypothetical protein
MLATQGLTAALGFTLSRQELHRAKSAGSREKSCVAFSGRHAKGFETLLAEQGNPKTPNQV